MGDLLGQREEQCARGILLLCSDMREQQRELQIHMRLFSLQGEPDAFDRRFSAVLWVFFPKYPFCW